MRIGEYFVKQKYITPDQLQEALALQKQNQSLLLGQILVTMGIIPMKDLYKYVKSYLESSVREREALLEQDHMEQDQVEQDKVEQDKMEQDKMEEEARSWITQKELDELLEEKSRGQW